jgi:hypothetical protein
LRKVGAWIVLETAVVVVDLDVGAEHAAKTTVDRTNSELNLMTFLTAASCNTLKYLLSYDRKLE